MATQKLRASGAVPVSVGSVAAPEGGGGGASSNTGTSSTSAAPAAGTTDSPSSTSLPATTDRVAAAFAAAVSTATNAGTGYGRMITPGATVRVVTNLNETFEGVVFTYDEASNLLVLEVTVPPTASPPPPPPSSSSSSASSATSTTTPSTSASSNSSTSNSATGSASTTVTAGTSSGTGKEFVMTSLNNAHVMVVATSQSKERSLPDVNMDAVREKEWKAVQERRHEKAKIGRGVTEYAQSLFDTICRTLNCEWDGTTIVVMNSIRIQPPYSPQSCTGGPASSLARIRKILERERARSGSAQ